VHDVFSSELSLAVDEDRYRSVVDQFHAHHRLELAGCHWQGDGTQFSHEIFVERTGLVGLCCAVEGWSPSFAQISVQGELRHEENPAADIGNRPVHRLASHALEQARVANLCSDVPYVRWTIIPRDTDEDNQSTRDLAREAVAYVYTRFGYPLNDRSHALCSVRAP
jgi:hypothetical protein